jgi:eukaryotic-like serine/threonine-protein kinase
MPGRVDDVASAPDDGDTDIVADDVDDAPSPTVIDRPPRGRVTGPAPVGTGAGIPTTSTRVSGSTDAGRPPVAAGSSSGGTTSTVASPLDALAHAEVLRTRHFAKVCTIIAVSGGVAIPALPGEFFPSLVMETAIGAAIVAMLYLIYRTHHPETFKPDWKMSLAWYLPAIAVCSAVLYFGPYSPVPVLLVLGIYIISMGQDLGVALAIYITCAVVEAVTGALPIVGVADLGFIKASYLTTPVQVMCIVLVEIVLLGSFIIARMSRASQLAALAELERAVRAVAQREALLEEARDELRGALGRGRGRFTEQQIGRYKLGDVIGRGAMGEVYEATDPKTEDPPVAIKMLASSSLSNKHHVQRFLRELGTAAAIESPNVVRVLEIGEQPLPHLVMERLRGRDLASILRDRRPMSHDKVIDLVRQVGAGITAAGAAGVIHRDLKPQNLFLSGTTWKILDFGVSRLADAGDTLTAGHVVGTPAYMAPEQARGAEVSHRTDLYALAAIAFRTLTGHAPYAGGEIADVLYRVVHTAPRRPSSLASLPDDVDTVLAIGLAKDPAKRFATAAELADALAAALTGALDEPTRSRGRALIHAGAWASK